MVKGKGSNSAIMFFGKSAWITMLILLPFFIISNNLFAIEEWWWNNPDKGLLFALPALVVVLRRLYTAAKRRS